MAFGSLSPYPRRFGGGRSRVREALEDLTADRGDAFDASNTETVVYVENLALARAIAAGWGTNERLSRLWTPLRASMDVIARWEKILALGPSPLDTDAQRRARVQDVLERFGQASVHAQVEAELSEKLGDAFVAIEYLDLSLAVITVPDGSYPWGSVASDAPWSSTVARILVRLQKPMGWSEADFYAAAGEAAQILDPLIPSWATFDWYRGPDSGAISVPGGPSGAGFFLDTEHNLDNQVFDV